MIENENFINNIILPNDNGEKHHRCHKELAKIIANLQERIKELEFFERMERVRYPDRHWKNLEKSLKKVERQEEKLKEEERKLKKLKFDVKKTIYPHCSEKYFDGIV